MTVSLVLSFVLCAASFLSDCRTVEFLGNYEYTFEDYHLLKFRDQDSAWIFVISKKGDEMYEEGWDSLQVGRMYTLEISELDSIPPSLVPVSGFNIRGCRPLGYCTISDMDSNFNIKHIATLYDYRSHAFCVPLYVSPDISGVRIHP